MFTKPLTTAFQCDGIYYAVVDGILIPMSDFAADQVVDVQTAACLGDEVWLAGPGGIRGLVGGPFTGQIVPVCTPPECLGFSYLHAGLDGIWAAGDGRLAKLSKEGLVKDWKAGLDGLPYDHFTALTLSDDGTQVAIGHDIGVTLLHVEAGTSEYFHSLR